MYVSLAVGQALIGLLGVVVGAVITGGAGYLMARRAERRARRAALRLIAHEITNLDVQMQPPSSFIADSAVRLDVLSSFSLDLWTQHRQELAESLDDDDWTAISNAYSVLELFKSWGEELTIDRITPDRLAIFRDGAAAMRHAAGVSDPALKRLLFG